MNIETKYKVGDAVFFRSGLQIKKGKIVDVIISANKYSTNVIYEVNDAPSWLEKFSYGWFNHSKKYYQGDLYMTASEIGDEIIDQFEYEIDILLKKIGDIKKQVDKQQDNGK